MKEHMKYLWITCLSALINGCGSSQDPPVAEIGPHQITAGSLRDFVAEWPGSLPSQKTGDDARRHYLQIMIDARLLLKISNLTNIQNWSATVNEPTITPTFSEDSVPAARAT